MKLINSDKKKSFCHWIMNINDVLHVELHDDKNRLVNDTVYRIIIPLFGQIGLR